MTYFLLFSFPIVPNIRTGLSFSVYQTYENRWDCRLEIAKVLINEPQSCNFASQSATYLSAYLFHNCDSWFTTWDAYSNVHFFRCPRPWLTSNWAILVVSGITFGIPATICPIWVRLPMIGSSSSDPNRVRPWITWRKWLSTCTTRFLNPNEVSLKPCQKCLNIEDLRLLAFF